MVERDSVGSAGVRRCWGGIGFLTLASAIVLAVVILAPSGVHAAEAVGIELPAGDFVRLGEYFPALLELEESSGSGQTEILVIVGRLAFAEQVSMSQGTSGKVLLWLTALEEHPDISVEVRSAGRIWSYPQLARVLTDRLRVIPRNEHLVGILSDVPDSELTWLFEHGGIRAVRASTRLEFPGEALGNFDVVAFDGGLWNRASQRIRAAIEDYVKSGGKVYILEHERMQFPIQGARKGEVLSVSSWGLGEWYLLNQDYRLSTLPQSSINRVKEQILSALGLLEPRRDTGCQPSELKSVFEPVPRYMNSRRPWAVYLMVCFLILCAAGLCSVLRLWSGRFTYALLPLLAVGLSTGFALILPAGDLAYERIAVTLTATGAESAVERSYIQLCSFGDSSLERRDLGVPGFILPAMSHYAGSWNSSAGRGGRRNPLLTLHNGSSAGVSGLAVQREKRAVFLVEARRQLDGRFEVTCRDGRTRVTNNSGFDLHDCICLSSGRVKKLGDLRFGQTISLPGEPDELLSEYLGATYSSSSREGRIYASFAQKCLRKHTIPGRSYLTGWADGGSHPSDYAQVSIYDRMWIVEVKARD